MEFKSKLNTITNLFKYRLSFLKKKLKKNFLKLFYKPQSTIKSKEEDYLPSRKKYKSPSLPKMPKNSKLQFSSHHLQYSPNPGPKVSSSLLTKILHTVLNKFKEDHVAS